MLTAALLHLVRGSATKDCVPMDICRAVVEHSVPSKVMRGRFPSVIMWNGEID
jgi:hypothetical protein